MSQKDNLKFASLQEPKQRAKGDRKRPATPIQPAEGSTKTRKRIGRGRATGVGKTSGKGQKGQKSRAGFSRTAGFEGGQMPLHRRLPKRGFRNIFSKEFQEINLFRLEKAGLSGDVTPALLAEKRLISDATKPVKVLGTGDIKSALKITADMFSETAKKKIEAAGGSCTERDLKAEIKASKKAAAEARTAAKAK